MSQIKFKNLPKGFEYPITKKEVRDFIGTTDFDVEDLTFSFGGIAEHFYKSSTSSVYFVVYITALPDESHWHFTVEISGLKPERYEQRREEIAQAILSHIKSWVCGKLSLSVTAPKKPSRASLNFDLTRRDIIELQEKEVFHPKGTAPGVYSSF